MNHDAFVVGVLFTLLAFHACSEEPSDNRQIDLTASDSLSLLAADVISTQLYERDLAISPNQSELVYTVGDLKQKHRCLVHYVKVRRNEWQGPEVLSISGSYQDIEPFFSPDGRRLYFASNRPLPGTSSTDYNIWYSDIIAGEYRDPVALDTIINTGGNEFYPSVAANGNLYFTATRIDGIGREDIFVSLWDDNTYSLPIALDTAINTELFEFNAYVSPNESMLIFSSYGRSDDYGGGDLYISRKNDANEWSKAQNVGPILNSPQLDFCPFVDLNSNIFYFTSERTNELSGRITDINQLQELSTSPHNGFGNIYKIDFNEVLENLQ